MARGPLVAGNIDVTKIVPVANPDGTQSTVRSITATFGDGRAVLIPTVVGGRIVSNQEAIGAYQRSGQHLGIFSTEADANAHALALHKSEAVRLAAIASARRPGSGTGKAR